MSDCVETTPVLLCSQCCEGIKIVSEAVTCNGICGQMFHPQCIQLPRIFLNALKQPKRNFFWVCDSCLSQDAKGSNYGVTILLERLYGILVLQSEQINIIRKEMSSLKGNKQIGEICNQLRNKPEVNKIDTSRLHEKSSAIDISTAPTESQKGQSAVIECSTDKKIEASPAPSTGKIELRGQFINNLMQLRRKKINFFANKNDSSNESNDLNEKLEEFQEVKRDIPLTSSQIADKIQFASSKLSYISALPHRTELDKLPAIVPAPSETKAKPCIRRKAKLRPIRRRPQINLKEGDTKSKEDIVIQAEKENFSLETNSFARLQMPKKCPTPNKKAVVSKCKRATSLEPETTMSKVENEVTFLDDSMSKKKSRKDARMKQVQRKREQLAKKVEKLDTLELESKVMNTKGEHKRSHTRKRPLPTNESVPQIQTQQKENLNEKIVDVAKVTEAVDILDNNEKQEDKFPERRMRAAYMSYVEKTLPILKKENPTLKLSQLKQVLQKEWYHSPANPLNKR